MDRRCLLLALTSGFLAACRPQPGVQPPGPVRLLDPPHAASWRDAGIPDQGPTTVKDGILTLAAGQPMTGATFTTWSEAGLPLTSYAIQYEAMRLEGEDFFGTVTFPVGALDTHVSFVLGGWGGTVTGISSIDFSDANENQTRAEQRFENHRWYRVRIEVRPEDLRVWLDGRLTVNVSIKGRKLSLRPGFIDHCRPFGFASFGTEARIREVVITPL